MKGTKAVRGLFLLLLCVAPCVAAPPPVVLVTIRPLVWMVQSLAPAGTEVQLLVPDGVSPHDYQLRPADAARVGQSALLVWVGPGMEPWLVQLAAQLPEEKRFALAPYSLHDDHDTDGDRHDDAHHDDAHTDAVADIGRDPHIWLDPLALRAQAAPLATQLIRLFPAEQKQIRERQQKYENEMTALDAELSARLAPVAQQGFVVYHDGYQRLVQRYHLNQRAAVWHHESIPMGARDRAQLLALLNSGEVRCLFYEPEHGRDAVNSWLGKSAKSVRMVEIDPLGGTVPDTVNVYRRFLLDLTGSMADCLAPSTSK